MARHELVRVSSGDWTELTNANVTEITFHNRGIGAVYIAVTTGAAPAGDTAFEYAKGTGELLQSLSAMAPGIAGTRVWAKAVTGASVVMVSHA